MKIITKTLSEVTGVSNKKLLNFSIIKSNCIVSDSFITFNFPKTLPFHFSKSILRVSSLPLKANVSKNLPFNGKFLTHNNQVQILPLKNKGTYCFSTDKNPQQPEKNDKKKQQKPKEPQQEKETQSSKEKGVSLFDIYRYFQKEFDSLFRRAKKMPRYQMLILGLLPFTLYFFQEQQTQEYPINYFESQVQSQPNAYPELTIKIKFYQEEIQYRIEFFKENKKYHITIYNGDIEKFKRILNKLSPNVVVKYEYVPDWDLKLTNVFTVAHIISVIFITAFFFRASAMGSVKKGSTKMSGLNQLMNKKTFQVITNTKVKFDDVAGLDQSKLQVKEFVDFLKNPEKYKKLGARIPKGVLLSGPPGTGKTLLGKACAGEAGVPFIPTSGSDFVEIFVGVGASRVRDLFATAREKSPAIIFIDEIDAVGRKRSGSHGSHDERDNTLNQILVEMDGFGTDSNVIVMAATNRQNLLDTALIRPGRFDRLIQINLPDLQGRKQIFNVHLSKINLESNRTKQQYARRLATLTPGFSGAQIANLCNEAAILAARNNKKYVDAHDLQMATERIIGGIERKSIISPQEKKTVAVHQSGHAAVAWYLQGADPLLKLTIIPRSKGSLGFAQYFVNQTKLNTRSQLIDRICFILGGRCAEEKFFGKITNGASDDLKKAYEIAHNIVVKLGMSEQIGYIGFKDPEYLRPYSQEMARKVDEEIIKIIGECTQRTRAMVDKYYEQIKNLSQELYQKETLTIREIRKILGERDFTSNQTYQKYLEVEKDLEKDQLPQQEGKPEIEELK